MKQIYFITTNQHKYHELELVANRFGYALKWVNIELDELQNDDIETIVRGKALYAYEKLHCPLIVDDSGLFIASLKDFPGTMTAHTMRTIGLDGLRKLCQDKDKKAVFSTVLVYRDSEMTHVGRGEVSGILDFSRQQKDSILASDVFVPDGANESLTKLMTTSYQSHRKLAAEALFNKLNKEACCAE